MSRCKACNRKLLDHEMVAKNPFNEDEYEDICSVCRPLCTEKYSYTGDHEYQFEWLEDGLQSPNDYVE